MRSMPQNVVVVDAGPLLALFDVRDKHHSETVVYFRRTRFRFLATLAVVTEAMYLFGPALAPKKNLLTWINSGAVTLIHPNEADLERVVALLDKYADRPMDFADGLTVAVCERLGVQHIATFDSDFDFYRFNDRQRFVNVLRR